MMLVALLWYHREDWRALHAEFTDPRPQAEVMLPPVSEGNRFNGNQMSVDVAAGRLVMFPSWMRHNVPPNRGDEERISIAINYMLDQYVETSGPPLWQGSARIDKRLLKDRTSFME